MTGGTSKGSTETDRFFADAERARQMGAARYRCGSREIDWRGPPSPTRPEATSATGELDYGQQEKVVEDWLQRRGLDRNGLENIIRREEEALSA